MSHSIFKKNELIKAQSEIISKSKELGFDTIGFAKPELQKEVKNNLNNFLENNYHGEMDWLKKNQYRRESPKNLWPDANAYDKTALKLATMFNENFKKYKKGTDKKIVKAGPKIF